MVRGADISSGRPDRPSGSAPSWQDLLSLARRILRYADVRVPRTVFLRKLSRLLLNASGCDALDLTRMKSGALRYQCRAELIPGGEFLFRSRSFSDTTPTTLDFGGAEDQQLIPFRELVLHGQLRGDDPHATAGGGFWCDDLRTLAAAPGGTAPPGAVSPRSCRSVAILRFEIEEGNHGLLELRSHQPGFLNRTEIEFWECLAQFIGITIADRRAREALDRRINELSCLNELAQLPLDTALTREALLERVAGLLPSAFPFPGRAQVGLIVDGRQYGASWPADTTPDLITPLLIGGRPAGEIRVRLGGSEGADFTVFEQREFSPLLDGLAGQVGLLLERHRSAQDHQKLQGQLRHADRLATIGQLAAGIAHELNEPLASILGFAELLGKESALPEQAAKDLDRIVSAALHGREIVRKLLIFARQMPTQKRRVDLNEVVRESIALLSSRCAREAVELDLALAEIPLLIAGDPAQLQQVLVNLVVNAIQAMPAGGRLTILTRGTEREIEHEIEREIELVVTDTGTGMSEDVRRQIFLPFFTTKEVGQGTGLGLAVVHGIVESHGGRIEVWSRPGEGSRFTVSLPASEQLTAGATPPPACPGPQSPDGKPPPTPPPSGRQGDS